MRLSVFFLASFIACGAVQAFDSENPVPLESVLQIDGSKVLANVSPQLYGLTAEEVNHALDGGLYAELVQNRIFLDNPSRPVHWFLIQDGAAIGSASLVHNQLINPVLSTCLMLVAKEADEKQRVGIANDGFWGIPIFPRTSYRLSLYAKGLGPKQKDFKGKLTATLESSDGLTVYASAVIPSISSVWQTYSAVLTTGNVTPTTDARLVIAVNDPGQIWLNLVSLFPPTYQDHPNGNRIDLMQKLVDLKASFLRFPGGRFSQGDGYAARFVWKSTLQDLSLRPGHLGPWRYRSSDGLGMREYLQICRDLNVAPVLVVYAGYAPHQLVIPAGPALQPYVQDALDEIEYITGDDTTVWGRERISENLPDPLPLTYIEIGNDEAADKSGTYDQRFGQFFEAIKARYPNLQIIASAKVKTHTPDVVDEHLVRSVSETLADLQRFDHYSRNGPKICVGEWATTEGSPTPTVGAALADAAWLISLERNADLVVMESYSPLLVNVNPGASQKETSLIGFNGLASFGSPSYYVQKMFAGNHGDEVLGSSISGGEQPPYSVTYDTQKHLIYIKVVNLGNVPQSLRIELTGFKVANTGQAIILKSDDLSTVNSLTAQVRVAPEIHNENNVGPSFGYTFSPYSATVLILSAH